MLVYYNDYVSFVDHSRFIPRPYLYQNDMLVWNSISDGALFLCRCHIKKGRS